MSVLEFNCSLPGDSVLLFIEQAAEKSRQSRYAREEEHDLTDTQSKSLSRLRRNKIKSSVSRCNLNIPDKMQSEHSGLSGNIQNVQLCINN